MRAYFLYGVNKKDYMGLYCSENMNSFLKQQKISNSESAVSTIIQLLGDYNFPDNITGDYYSTDEKMVIRYSPVYLAKYKSPLFQDADPFGAIVAIAPQTEPKSLLTESRSIVYKHLTVLAKEDICNHVVPYTYLDSIFGTKIFTNEDIKYIADGYANFDEEYHQLQKCSYTDLEGDLLCKDFPILSLAITALYYSPECKVVIRLKKEDSTIRRGRQILKKIYSFLPPLMAFNTGFSLNDDWKNISSCVKKANIRIFIISGREENITPSLLPPMTLLIDIDHTVAENPDKEFEQALLYWNSLGWEKRKQAMQVIFENSTGYFLRDTFLSVTKAFRENLVWKYIATENPEQALDKRKLLLKFLLSEYTHYCQAYSPAVMVPWVQDLYKMRFINNLPMDIEVSDTLKSIQDFSAMTILKLKVLLLKYSILNDSSKEKWEQTIKVLELWLNTLFPSELERIAVEMEYLKEKQEEEYRKYLEEIAPGSTDVIDDLQVEREEYRAAFEKEKEAYRHSLQEQVKQYQISMNAEAERRSEQQQMAFDSKISDLSAARKREAEKYQQRINELTEKVEQLQQEIAELESSSKRRKGLWSK